MTHTDIAIHYHSLSLRNSLRLSCYYVSEFFKRPKLVTNIPSDPSGNPTNESLVDWGQDCTVPMGDGDRWPTVLSAKSLLSHCRVAFEVCSLALSCWNPCTCLLFAPKNLPRDLYDKFKTPMWLPDDTVIVSWFSLMKNKKANQSLSVHCYPSRDLKMTLRSWILFSSSGLEKDPEDLVLYGNFSVHVKMGQSLLIN